MQKKSVKKVKPVYKNFFYLVPEKLAVSKMCEKLDFLSPDALEIWTEINVLEITTETGTITFEDITEDMQGEDLELMDSLSVSQIFICDYQNTDSSLVQKVMKKMLAAFGGKIGQDTEDFGPFREISDL